MRFWPIQSAMPESKPEDGSLPERVSVREAARSSDDGASSLGEKNLELAWESWRNGDLAAAEIHARQAIRFDERDAWAHFVLGCVLVEVQRPKEAEAPMTRAVRLRPTKAAFHRKLGELFNHLGLASDAKDEESRYLESAEKCFRAAIRLNPEDAAAHCALALRLAGTMRHEEAERAYRTAVALEPEESKYHCELGEYISSFAAERRRESARSTPRSGSI